jgi:hypothetical protein
LFTVASLVTASSMAATRFANAKFAFVYTIEVPAVLIISARILQSGSLRDFSGPMRNSARPVPTENAVVALFESVFDRGRFRPGYDGQ